MQVELMWDAYDLPACSGNLLTKPSAAIPVSVGAEADKDKESLQEK